MCATACSQQTTLAAKHPRSQPNTLARSMPRAQMPWWDCAEAGPPGVKVIPRTPCGADVIQASQAAAHEFLKGRQGKQILATKESLPIAAFRTEVRGRRCPCVRLPDSELPPGGPAQRAARRCTEVHLFVHAWMHSRGCTDSCPRLHAPPWEPALSDRSRGGLSAPHWHRHRATSPFRAASAP